MRTVVLVVLITSMVAGVGFAQQETFVRGHPELDVFVPDPTLVPGTTSELTLQVANSGEVTGGASNQPELVTTARNVRVDVNADDAPVTIETGRHSIGPIPGGQATSDPITVTVPESAKPGEYSLEVELEYAYYGLYSARSDVFQDESRTVTRTVEVEISDRPRFELRTVGSGVQVGGSGTLTVAVENVGGEPARDVDVNLESSNPSVTFGRSRRGSAHISRLAPGEASAAEFDVRVGENAFVQNYTLDGSVRFTDPDGVRHTVEGLSAAVTPGAEQTFAVRDLRSDLHVGETGSIRFTVVNTGPRAVHAATLLANASALRLSEREHGLGDLEPGERRSVELPASAARTTEAIPRRVMVTVLYETADGDPARSDQLPIVVDVAPDRDRLTVEGVETNVSIDASNEIVLTVENTADVTYDDVTVRLAPNPPFSSVSPEAFVATLAPGESARLRYELSVADDAVPSTHGLRVNVTAEEPDGDTFHADPEQVVVTVVPQGTFEQDWIVVLLGGVVVGVVLIVGYVVTRRA